MYLQCFNKPGPWGQSVTLGCKFPILNIVVLPIIMFTAHVRKAPY